MRAYIFNPDDARRFVSEQHLGVHRDNGTELVTKMCPYCRNETRDRNTFAINLQTGAFNCKRSSCGMRGNMITLAKDFDFSLGRDADEYYNSKRKFRSLRRYPVPEVKPEAVAYMESRGIRRNVTERYHITTHKDNGGIIIFPFFSEAGELTFIKYRNANPKPGQNKEWCAEGCKPILFGMDHCDPADGPLVMTEGQIDSLSCAEAGIKNAVSVPTGAKGFTWVPYCWDFLCKFKELIIFGDHENGHITLLDEMRDRFRGLLRYVHPDDYIGCKDANELLVKHGADAVRNAINRAVPIEDKDIEHMEDVERQRLTDMEHFSTGIRKLDETISGFFMGQLILLTGERGQGKSTLASQFGAFAIKAGYKVFFYSGELIDYQMKDWFDRQVAGDRYINHGKTTIGFEYYYADENSMDAIEDWYAGKAFVYNNRYTDPDAAEANLLETVENAAVQQGCRVFIIDNLMTAMMDDLNSDLYRQQTAFVAKLTALAHRYNALVILVVHPRKRGAAEFGNDDVSGSANITNLASVVLHYTLPKQDQSGDRILRVIKSRNTGKNCFDGIPLWYQESSKRISEHEDIFDWEFGWEPNNKGEYFKEPDEDDEIPW